MEYIYFIIALLAAICFSYKVGVLSGQLIRNNYLANEIEELKYTCSSYERKNNFLIKDYQITAMKLAEEQKLREKQFIELDGLKASLKPNVAFLKMSLRNRVS
jgi:hypothetical protein